MFFEALPRKTKRRAAARRIARRQLELGIGAAVAGTVAGWLVVIQAYPHLSTGIVPAAFFVVGGVVVGVLLKLRQSPPQRWVERMAKQLGPAHSRRMLSRLSVVLITVLAALFGWLVGQWQVREPAALGEASAPHPPASSATTLDLGPPASLALPSAEPASVPVTIRFGWEPGLRLRARQLFEETREAPGRVTEVLTARVAFSVVTEAHTEGLKVALTNFVEESLAGGSLRGRADYASDAAIMKATPPFLVDTEGRFVRILDADAAVQRARDALESRPVALGSRRGVDPRQLDGPWLEHRARQLWNGWSHGVVQKSPWRGSFKETTQMPLPYLGNTVEAELTWQLIGERPCGDGTRCVVIESRLQPNRQALDNLIAQGVALPGSPARLAAYDRGQSGYLVVDEQSLVHQLETLVTTTTTVVMPGGLRRTQRKTRRTQVSFTREK